MILCVRARVGFPSFGDGGGENNFGDGLWTFGIRVVAVNVERGGMGK
jgi:hypothetical protein